MKKQIILFSILIVLFFSLYCNIARFKLLKEIILPPNKIFAAVKYNSQIDFSNLINENNKNCIFHLGMKKNEFKLKLNELKIKIIKEIESRNDNWEPTGAVTIYTKDMEFYFDQSDFLSEIDINEQIPTKLGLQKGDTFEKMIKLYGKKYTFDKGWNMYIYEMSGHYFSIVFENNKIDYWKIYIKR